jgi:tetratricopeptide (TPR) repeat protein
MGRLGLTMRDVVTDSSSQIALAQAMNVRYFNFSAIEQTQSLNVTSHLIDAQSGARTGTGMIHVQDHNEMKLRLDELARQVLANPAEQARLAAQGKENEHALASAKKLLQAGNFSQAAAVAGEALKKAPKDVALHAVQQEAEQKARQVALAESQRREAEAHKAAALAAQQRQQELARQTEAARQKAEAEVKARGPAATQDLERQRALAAERLRSQAQAALKQKNYGQAVQALQSAAALHPTPELQRELAAARTEEDNAAHAARTAQESAAQATRQKEQALAQERLAAERAQLAKAALEKRKAQEAKDQAQQAQLLEQARQQLAKKQFDQALTTLVAAQHVGASPEIDRLLQQARDGHALEEARKQGDAAHAAQEKKLAAEKAQRDQAAAVARQKQDQYLAALGKAHKAVADKKYDEAIVHYQEAEKVMATDVVANGLRQAQLLRARDAQQRQAQEARPLPPAQPRPSLGGPVSTPVKPAVPVPVATNAQAEYGKAMQTAAALEKQGKFAEALEEYRLALRAVPKDTKAAAGLHKAEYQSHMAQGQKLLATRHFADAATAFEAALKLEPMSKDAKAFLQKAKAGK